MATLGGALAAWSNVENNMGLLFNAASGIPDMQKSGAIFDAVVAFEARLAVLNATIENDNSLSEEDKELWACLSDRLRKLYKKRHEVAHFSVIGDVPNATSIAPFFTWNKHNRNAIKSLTITQIFERSGKFSEAANAMSWFVNLVQRAKFPPPIRPQPLAEPDLIVRIRGLIAQKREAQTPQPQSSPAR
jgi:hypothetical protein